MPDPKVLIVEDNVDLAKAMVALLRRSGYTAATTGNGQAALQLLRQCRPQLVLLDVNLPARDGLQILQDIRGDAQLGVMPVVMYTAIDDPEVRDEAMALGAVEYVVKGALDAATLAELVRRYIPAAA